MKKREIEAKRWLKQLRKGSGLSQAALAELVDVDRRTIVNAESERDETGLPQGFTLFRILQELDALVDAPAPQRSRLATLEAAVAELPTRAELLEGLETLRAAIESVTSRDTAEAQSQRQTGERAR